MAAPVIAIVADRIDDSSSIASIAAWDAREALRRGWQVVAVCQRLDPELAPDVEHAPLFVPPRVHLVQYAAGRTAARWALRGHRPDVVVTHLPQSAAIADVWNVHFLERVAQETSEAAGGSLRSWAHGRLDRGVRRLEDRYVSGLPPSTRVMFCSDRLCADFAAVYGAPPSSTVVPNAAPDPDPIEGPDARRRTNLVGAHRGPVVGFLGGRDHRKGADILAAAVAAEPGLFAIVAGAPQAAEVAERTRELGYLDDVRDLLDAVDALVVPSRFDPFALAVLESAARGVPVIVTEPVGSAPLIVEHGAGLVWDGRSPLEPLVRQIRDRRARFRDGAVDLARALDRHTLADRRFSEFAAAAERNTGR